MERDKHIFYLTCYLLVSVIIFNFFSLPLPSPNIGQKYSKQLLTFTEFPTRLIQNAFHIRTANCPLHVVNTFRTIWHVRIDHPVNYKL